MSFDMCSVVLEQLESSSRAWILCFWLFVSWT